VALPGLAADPSVLATVVLATYSSEPPIIDDALPEGFDARITFDRARARAHSWPAIDPEHTSVRSYPDSRHEHLARAARTVLTDYTALDPAVALPDPSTFDDPTAARRAQDLLRYLTHSFRPFEMLSALPAANTPMAEVLDTVEDLVSR
jgi:F0F1-type ATP synthase beta subunit